MGRSLRRLMERQNKIESRKGKKLMSKEDLHQLSDTISEYNVETMMTCFSLVLHREFGFGKTRIFRVLEGVDNLMGGILDGSVTVSEYKQQLEDEAGVRIQT